MDDLVGLDWSSTSAQTTSKPQPSTTSNYFSTLRPTPPISGRSTPAAVTSTKAPSTAPTKPSIPGAKCETSNDRFANLIPFTSTHSTKNLSLQDRQILLQEQHAKQELDRRKELDKQFGSLGSITADHLVNGRSTPERVIPPPSYTGTSEYGGPKLSAAINKPFASIPNGSIPASRRKVGETEDDLLAAFDAATPVDRSSNYPVPSDRRGNAIVDQKSEPNGHNSEDLEDDPFGLGIPPSSEQGPPKSISKQLAEDDDVLGLLGKPLSELLPPKAQRPKSHNEPVPDDNATQLDRAIAELIDMGFPADKSENALLATESGHDVQMAVGLLLNQAHEDSRSKGQASMSRGRETLEGGNRTSRKEPTLSNGSEVDAPMPAWMKQQSRSNSTQRREDSRSPAFGDKDPAKMAAELGNNLFKTANSLWKTGTKKLNQAVSEFNSDSDSSQPKWMREIQDERRETASRQRRRVSGTRDGEDAANHVAPGFSRPEKSSNITDEALMLESGDVQPRASKRSQPSRPTPREIYSSDSSRDHSPATLASMRKPTSTEPRLSQQQQPILQGRSKLSKQAVEEESMQAYVSSARRRKPTAQPASPKPDLLFDASNHAKASSQPRPISSLPSRPKLTTPPQPHPVVLKRTVPPLSSSAHQTSTTHRLAGTNFFKLGNYAEATTSYTTALSPLPPTHPLTIPLHTNLALTHLKTGDPKSSLTSASTALSLIGPSKGTSETIDLGPSEVPKPMSLYWSKATTRRAEALEQLERWSEALAAWKECVEAGVGGTNAIQARDRCERAVTGRSLASAPATSSRQPPPPSSSKRPTTSRPIPPRSSPSTAPSAEAVTRLRAANAAAERAEDEKFALADQVDERLVRWRKGKEGNLRALLGSLETVLWEGAGWRKVGMSELVVPGRVKAVYVRGIGRVHPDKVSWSVCGSCFGGLMLMCYVDG